MNLSHSQKRQVLLVIAEEMKASVDLKLGVADSRSLWRRIGKDAVEDARAFILEIAEWLPDAHPSQRYTIPE